MLAKLLSQVLRRSVVDETGLSGSFDINLTWSGPDLFQRVKEQLGLELASAKRPIQELVVDRSRSCHPLSSPPSVAALRPVSAAGECHGRRLPVPFPASLECNLEAALKLGNTHDSTYRAESATAPEFSLRT